MDSLTTQPTPAAQHDYSHLMSLALDGMLSAGEQEDLDQHLAACPACQRTWGKWQRISQVLTVEPFAGPSLGFALRLDSAMQRRELRRQRLAAVAILVGGTLAVLTLLLLSTTLTVTLLMSNAPGLGARVVESLGFGSQFITLVWQNLTAVRDALAALLPDPLVMMALALALVMAGLVWVRLVFYDARAR
ncbi:MAG TPA: zf-HC2 domain-containing protein [Anaerolineae bacterium]|nr:zf-HC2 domain-containing protein [Anaerolineae bacterium]